MIGQQGTDREHLGYNKGNLYFTTVVDAGFELILEDENLNTTRQTI